MILVEAGILKKCIFSYKKKLSDIKKTELQKLGQSIY